VSLPSVSPKSIAENITTLILLFPSCSSGAVLLQLLLQWSLNVLVACTHVEDFDKIFG
jgi:hypothetical protein